MPRRRRRRRPLRRRSRWRSSTASAQARPRGVNDQALTAERILETAEDVLRRFGPAKATVVDVARALGVSHGSVYRHFPSKAALRDAVTERWLARISTPLAAVAAEAGPAPAAAAALARPADRRQAAEGPATTRSCSPPTSQLAADAREVVRAARRRPRRPAGPDHRRRRRPGRVRGRRPGHRGPGGLRRHRPLPQPGPRSGVVRPRHRRRLRGRPVAGSARAGGAGRRPGPLTRYSPPRPCASKPSRTIARSHQASGRWWCSGYVVCGEPCTGVFLQEAAEGTGVRTSFVNPYLRHRRSEPTCANGGLHSGVCVTCCSARRAFGRVLNSEPGLARCQRRLGRSLAAKAPAAWRVVWPALSVAT